MSWTLVSQSSTTTWLCRMSASAFWSTADCANADGLPTRAATATAIAVFFRLTFMIALSLSVVPRVERLSSTPEIQRELVARRVSGAGDLVELQNSVEPLQCRGFHRDGARGVGRRAWVHGGLLPR